MRDKRMMWAVIIVVASVLLLAVVGPYLANRKTSRSEPPPSVQAQQGLSAKGTVESSEEILVSSQVKGVVSKVLVEAGDSVKKGQLLLVFDMGKMQAQQLQARAAVAAAEARLAEVSTGFRSEDVAIAQQGNQRSDAVYREARDEVERMRRLLAKDAVTLVEVNRAEERFKIAEAQLKESEANLKKYRTGSRSEEVRQAKAAYDRAVADQKYIESVAKDYKILSPIDGVVAERHRDKGESTDIDTPLFKLVNPMLSRVRAELEESEVGKVQSGQKAEVIVDAYPGKHFNGTVTRVFPVVQKKTQKNFDPMATFDIHTQEIHVALQDSSSLKNGMTVTVRFK